MNPHRWREIERVVQAALERPEKERAAFLDEACAGDAALRNVAQCHTYAYGWLPRTHAQRRYAHRGSAGHSPSDAVPLV